jgi:hypothetical protein
MMHMTDDVRIGKSPLETSRGFRSKLWVGFVLAVVLLRLAMSADRDVVALNSPYDEFWFIHSAARWVWGGNYNQMAFAHLPIYSIWLAGLDLLGLPARLAIDLAWLASTAYAGFALAQLTGKRWAGALFWLFCAFHPVMLVLFDRALAETLLAVLVALIIGAGVEVWNTRAAPRSRRSIWAGAVFTVAFALAVHIRKETILLLLPVLALAAGSLLARRAWWHTNGRRSLGMRLVAWPLLATLAVGLVLTGLNYLRWGVAARYELAAPGYVRAIAALNRIDAGPGPLHITVTRKSRELAYAHSPTFRELQGFFEGEPGRFLGAHSGRFTGHPDEIGNGWFYWALRDAGATAGWHRDARTAEHKYNAMAQELESAFAEGSLPSHPRWIPSFLDPDLGKWIARVPASMLTILGLTLESDPGTVQAASENASTSQLAEFIEVAARRNPPQSVSVRGWVVLPAGTAVGLAPAGQMPAQWQTLALPERADVPGALAFSLHLPSAATDAQLIAKLADGQLASVPVAQLQAGHMAQLSGVVSAALGVDEMQGGHRRSQLAMVLSWWSGKPVEVNALMPLSVVYRWLALTLAVGMAAAWVVWLVTRRVSAPVLVVSALMAMVLLSRAGLLGVLDASSWSGAQARYMASFIVAFAFLAVLALASLRGPRR